jgi:hypothetical protein
MEAGGLVEAATYGAANIKLPVASHFPKFVSGMAGKLSNFGNGVYWILKPLTPHA